MKIFLRTQLSSLLATSVDLAFTVALIEIVNFKYLIATTIGAIAGAVTNFLINKYWSFKMNDNKGLKKEGVKYLLVWFGSIFLNVLGSNAIMKLLNLPYLVSKISVSLIVGIGFNYTLQKKYVFSTTKNTNIL